MIQKNPFFLIALFVGCANLLLLAQTQEDHFDKNFVGFSNENRNYEQHEAIFQQGKLYPEKQVDGINTITYGLQQVIADDTIRYTYTYNTNGYRVLKLTEVRKNYYWQNFKRETYYFDNKWENIGALSEDWINDVWVNSLRNTQTYDVFGNMLVSLYEKWMNNSWTNVRRSTYTYDNNMNMLTALLEFWTDNVLVNSYKYTYEYNLNQKLHTQYYEIWTNNSLVNSYRYTYEYNLNQKLHTQCYEIWTNNSWINSSRSTYTYDDLGNNLKILYETWTNNSWVNSSRSTYTYDNLGKRISSLYERWTNNLWVNNSRGISSYDSFGNLTSELSEFWNNYYWDSYKLLNYTYDNKGNTISGKSYYYSNYSWIPSNTNLTFYYNDKGNSEIFKASKAIAKYIITYPNVSENTNLYLKTNITKEYVNYLKNELSVCNQTILNLTTDSLKLIAYAKRIFINFSLIQCDADSILNQKKPIIDSIDSTNQKLENFYKNNIEKISTLNSKLFFDDLLKLFKDPKYAKLKEEVESMVASYKSATEYLDFNSQGLLDTVNTRLQQIRDDFNFLKNNSTPFNLIVKVTSSGFDEYMIFDETHYKNVDLIIRMCNSSFNSFKTSVDIYKCLLKDSPAKQFSDSLKIAITYLSTGLDTLYQLLRSDPLNLLNINTKWISDTRKILDSTAAILNGRLYYLGNEKIKIRPVTLLEYPFESWGQTLFDFYRVTNRYNYTFKGLFPDALPASIVDQLKEDMIINLSDNEDKMNSRIMEYKNLYLNSLKQGQDNSTTNFGIALAQTYSFLADLNNEVKDLVKFVEAGNLKDGFKFKVINNKALTDSISKYFNFACKDQKLVFTILMITKSQSQPYNIELSTDYYPMFISNAMIVEVKNSSEKLIKTLEYLNNTFSKLGRDVEDILNMSLDPNHLDFSNVKTPLDLILALENSNRNFLEITPYGITRMQDLRKELRDVFSKYSGDLNNLANLFDSLSVYRNDFNIKGSDVGTFISKNNSFVQEVNNDFQDPTATTKINGVCVNLSAWFDNPPQHLLEKFKWYFDNDPSTDNSLGGLFPDRFSASGMLVYANSSATPVGNSKVCFNNENGIIDSTLTDDNGYFIFSNKPTGNYYLTATCNKPAGGVNSTDALMIRRFQAGAMSFDSLQLKAADVNGSSTINSTDALLIRRKVAGIDSEFKIGNWTFENPSFNLNGTNITKNIRSLCVGDVNGSFTPVLLRKIESVQLFGFGKTNYDNTNTAELSVSVNKGMRVGAFSLFLNYSPEQIEIIDITNKPDGLLFSAREGKLRIAWDDLTPLCIDADGQLFSIKVRLLAKDTRVPVKITIDPSCEIADNEGKIIDNVILKMPVEAAGTVNNFRLEQNYPNPFNPATTIQYTIPEKCFVTLRVFDGIGRQVALLVNEQQDMGKHIINFDARNLSTGVYFYKIQAGSFAHSHKMLLIK